MKLLIKIAQASWKLSAVALISALIVVIGLSLMALMIALVQINGFWFFLVIPLLIIFNIIADYLGGVIDEIVEALPWYQ